jgi:hypothetical protein
MKHRASQFVTILAFIELIQNSSTFGLVIDVGESVFAGNEADAVGSGFARTSGADGEPRLIHQISQSPTTPSLIPHGPCSPVQPSRETISACFRVSR